MKYKNIKSVAHNLGHSFLSDMNARGEGGRWVITPEALFRVARQVGAPQVAIDFLARTVEPAVVRTADLEQSVAYYADWLPKLLASQNVDPEAVRAARLTLTFDYARVRRTQCEPIEEIQEFECIVELADDRGVVHRATPTNWWRS